MVICRFRDSMLRMMSWMLVSSPLVPLSGREWLVSDSIGGLRCVLLVSAISFLFWTVFCSCVRVFFN
jgi:hypothetical protein